MKLTARDNLNHPVTRIHTDALIITESPFLGRKQVGCGRNRTGIVLPTNAIEFDAIPAAGITDEALTRRDSDAGIVGWGRIHFKKWQFTIHFFITQFGQNSSITAIQAILRSDVVVDDQ